MSFIDTVKTFFKGSRIDPVAMAACDAFSAASDACDAPFRAIEAYTNCANHRYAILEARYILYKAPHDDRYAAETYDKAVAAYTDPFDFAPYTEDYLDLHTAAMNTLSAAFDNLTVTSIALNPANNLYATAIALYKSYCDMYEFTANAYSRAAWCAVTTALEGNVQAAKDEFKVTLLEDRAAHATAADAPTAKANAIAFKAKVAEEATKTKLLELKARVAETKAKGFLAKAKSAKAKAEEALVTSP